MLQGLGSQGSLGDSVAANHSFDDRIWFFRDLNTITRHDSLIMKPFLKVQFSGPVLVQGLRRALDPPPLGPYWHKFLEEFGTFVPCLPFRMVSG